MRRAVVLVAAGIAIALLARQILADSSAPLATG